ncbi:MAG TPA: hypothetical protein P5169_05385 [Kiritimatiellia bacterium]|nr:hypothetical protein [Kiritimatiellia bacterium]
MIIKEQPGAKCESLRYLVGVEERRLAVVPVDPQGRVWAGYRTGPEQVTVFRVLGYGSTLARAKRRARVAAA